MKFGYAILCSVIITGCTGPKTVNMPYSDMNYYRTDCDHKDNQLALLYNQLDNTPFYDKYSKSSIQYYIRYLNTYCPEPDAEPQGCVAVRENFGPGTSQAVVCRSDQIKGPVVNRWEAEIDN